MAPGQAGGAEFTAEELRLVGLMRPLAAINLAAWLMMIPARPEMVLQVAGGDAMLASRILGSMTAGASLVEFLFTPLLGILSDKFGRKPFLVLIPIVGSIARLGTYLGFRVGTIASVTLTNTIDRALTGACGSMFFTAVGASASDVVLGPKLSDFMALITSYLGLAVMVGPYIGAQVIVRTGSAGNVALAAAAVCTRNADTHRRDPPGLVLTPCIVTGRQTRLRCAGWCGDSRKRSRRPTARATSHGPRPTHSPS